MITPEATERRKPKTVRLEADLCVVGGGLAGVCCAISAARAGVRVVLIQDRPVLGGNASSEVRLWVLGATSHLGNNNRWSREGSVIDEILIENLYRNPEGNPVLVDALLLEKVTTEKNITLLLNTAVYDMEKHDADTIQAVRAFNSQNSTSYEVSAPLFCDASGDGIVGFLAGAAFRMGAESREEFGEKFAPTSEYGELLGHSIYFYSRDSGRPVKFIAPSFALKDITKIPRYKSFSTGDTGCRLWWLEYGGRLDTVHETETIKWELWKVIYGIWDHIKNSGKFPDAQNLTLEWVGMIPGKRESRRFEGDYMLIQQDVVEQRRHADAVSFGGWSIDLHPADGIFSEKPGCNQWHSKGVYQIPYRCMYSRNIRNLFLAGRIISASHVAFGSSRVMATCAHGAQAVGLAAAMCREKGLLPRDISKESNIQRLQRALVRAGQYIPMVPARDPADLAPSAVISASTKLQLRELPDDGPVIPLAESWAMILPATAGALPRMQLKVDVTRKTDLRVELRTSSKPQNYTPDVTLESKLIPLEAGKAQSVALEFSAEIDQPRYVFVCVLANPSVAIHSSEMRVSGIVSACHKFNPAVAKTAVQTPPADIGVDTFEFWCPQRRPDGRNFAMTFSPPIDLFDPTNVANGVARPTTLPNVWVADPADAHPRLALRWDRPQRIKRVILSFDTDFDHPVESVLLGHPERQMPFCVKHFRVLNCGQTLLHEEFDNHQTRREIVLDEPIRTDSIVLELDHPSEHVPAALFEIRCYAD